MAKKPPRWPKIPMPKYGLGMLPLPGSTSTTQSVYQAREAWNQTVKVLDQLRQQAKGIFDEVELGNLRFAAGMVCAQLEAFVNAGGTGMESAGDVTGFTDSVKLFTSRLNTSGGAPLSLGYDDLDGVEDVLKPRTNMTYWVLGGLGLGLIFLKYALK